MLFRRFVFLFATVVLCVCFSGLSAQEAITKKRGKVRMHYADGKLHSKGKVRNYQRQGRWKYYSPEGKVIAVANFVNDTIHGFYNEWYGDGAVFITGTYCMNTKCGNWKTYAPDGTLISDENFVNGQMHGTQLFMFPSGKMREKIVAENGVIGSRTVWYANGNLQLIENYSKGLPHGRWVMYAELDTMPIRIDEYEHGLKHGWHYLYHGRQLVEKYHYENGKAHGESFRWDNDGKISMREYYTSGAPDSGFYYLHGVILRSTRFQYARKHGPEVDYDRSGDTLKLSWWKNGRVDSSFTYHENGRRSSSLIYDYTVQPEKALYTEWDTAGRKLQTGVYVADRRHGEWFTYYPDGKKRSVTNYSEGRMQGLFTKWYPNGKKMVEMNFLPAGVNTPPDAWNEKGKLLPMGSKAYNEIVEGNRPGEIFSDASQYNRPIIERRVEELNIHQD